MTAPQPASVATSRLRQAGYAAILAALAFAQSSGRIVADTKWDLSSGPLRFLAHATRMWDPAQAFGQVQNQAYGYLWPMGPFFVAGDALALPPWVIQRLWWTLLLWLAFFGVLRLCRELQLGKGWTQVVAAFAFVLAPRMTSLLGATSVELWPTALAPWVLIPLVRGSTTGSVRRAGAVAALVVACCGGVNATAVSAVLPLGVIWILTRAPGPRRWRLLGWWAGFTVLATLWWLAPLALQGGYSAPFLDYIENAHVTTAPTGLVDTLLGTSDWVVYLAPQNYPAGARLVTTPFMMLDAAALAALGLAGLLRTDNPERRFLSWGLLTGVLLVGLGYAGEVHGWWGTDRRDLLDGVLAPLRNTHKYDAGLRLVLSLGMAHVLSSPLFTTESRTDRRGARAVAVASVVALVGLAVPWFSGQVAAPGGFVAPPDYWRQAAAYLDDEAQAGSVALEVPAAAFGDYTWGSTHDDVLQPLVESPWAARNVVPLAEPGNVVLLDGVTSLLESGRPAPDLAPMLGSAGVRLLVVRNDLQRLLTGAPDPAYVHATLDSSPGLRKVASFGPVTGAPQAFRADDGTRVVTDLGLSGEYPSVEIYQVLQAETGATLSVPSTLLGDPGSPPAAALPGQPDPSWILAGDAPRGEQRRVVLTDGLRRRELAFQAVRRNASATLPAGSVARLPGPEQFHRILDDQERWQTTETWQGDAAVTASSSRAYADSGPPLDAGSLPAAAVDGDPLTAWRSSSNAAVRGQWIEFGLLQPRAVRRLTLRVGPQSAPVSQIRVSAAGTAVQLAAPAPGSETQFVVDLPAASSVRITAVDGPSEPGGGSWEIAEAQLDGVRPQRVLALPTPPDSALVDRVVLRRDQGSTACPTVGETVVCLPFLGSGGEDGDQLPRAFTLSTDAAYQLRVEGSLRRDPALSRLLASALGLHVRATGSAAFDVAESPVAMVDGDLGTSWRHEGGDAPIFRLSWAQRHRLESLTLQVGEAGRIAAPTLVEVKSGARTVTRSVGDDGRVSLPGWRARRLSVRILAAAESFSVGGGGSATGLPAGISEILVNGEPAATSLGGVDPSLAPFTCEDGPALSVNGKATHFNVFATVAGLLHGNQVVLLPCDATDEVSLPAGDTVVLGQPSDLFRIDEVTLDRLAAGVDVTVPLPGGGPLPVSLTSDPTGAPVRATVPQHWEPRVLALHQNFNRGWTASLDGEPLVAQRIDGWRQGWLVPPGPEGIVTFRYAPQTAYAATLAAGAAGVAVVAILALWRGRRGRHGRPEPEPLTAGTGGVVDVLLGVGLCGLLAGWPGVLIAVAVVWGRRTIARATKETPAVDAAWPLVGGGLVLAAALPRAWPWWDQHASSAQQSQLLAVGALALAVAGLAGSLGAKGPEFFRRRKGRSSP